jgi:hypothetical protein
VVVEIELEADLKKEEEKRERSGYREEMEAILDETCGSESFSIDFQTTGVFILIISSIRHGLPALLQNDRLYKESRLA